jgi:hypothetical protein
MIGFINVPLLTIGSYLLVVFFKIDMRSMAMEGVPWSRIQSRPTIRPASVRHTHRLHMGEPEVSGKQRHVPSALPTIRMQYTRFHSSHQAIA